MMSASVFTSLTNCVRTKGEGGGGRGRGVEVMGFQSRVFLFISNFLTVLISEWHQSQNSVKIG